MASVILPTTRWTDGCADVLASLSPDDELFVVADHPEDPVFEQAPGEAELVAAGDPVGCSGKANALAAGMERASHDIVVWTDDDVTREAGWRDRLVAHAREDGAATEVPVYVGGGLWRVLEPAMVLFGSLGLVSGGHVWGGGVAFDRTALDEAQLVAELRQTVGDDSLLGTYVEDPWVDTDNPRQVTVAGSPGAVRDRLARFAQAAFHFEPLSTVGLLAASALFAVFCLVAPLLGAPVTLAVGALSYRAVDLQRSSVLLSPLSFLVIPLALAVGLVVRTFEWGGRRYRWRGTFDVTVE
ncbi:MULTISPECIES: glycosyltransferase [Haloarcula]|uniref:glycosyltransferase n=1 Tax=Haloarcula TaxID=2237 RepID=UPI0023E7D7C4|nr:glycosyltransferase [Halomicroarcula sp. SHR3]